MKPRTLVLPLLFAAAILALALVFGVPSIGSGFSLIPPESMPSGLSEKYDAATLSFTDPELGYSLRYPTGYPLEVQDGQTVVFYAPDADGVSETFFWQALNETTSLVELKEAAAQLDGRLLSEKTVRVDGQNAWRLEYVLPVGQIGVPAHLIQGYVPCGNFSLYLAATIPDSLSGDLALADYALYSARCS